MIRATFRKLLRAVTGSAPQSPPPPRTPQIDHLVRSAPNRAVRTGNRYVPIPGHGPGAAARRQRAMVRTAKPVPDKHAYNTIHGERSKAAIVGMIDRMLNQTKRSS